MAEIIDSDKIKQKLKEFDVYIQQSIDTVKVLKEIKDDSQQIFSDMKAKKEIFSKIENNLIELQGKSINIYRELSKFKDDKESQIGDFITRYKKEADSISSLIQNKQEEFEKIISVIQKQWEDDFLIKLNEFKKEISDYRENNEKEIYDHKDQIQSLITNNQQRIDNQIADFLYKQNALISNLTQQIDSYHKLTDTLKITIAMQSDKITSLEKLSQEYKKGIDTLRSENDNVKVALEEILSELKKPLVKRLFGGKK